MTALPDLVATAKAIAAAEARIRPHIRETWLEPSPILTERIGAPVFAKLENLQKTGSFKARGALNKILAAPDDGRLVVTASTGNHGAGVAYALSRVGRPGVVFVPEGASEAKLSFIRRLGAKVETHGLDSIETELHVRRLAETEGHLFVPPYNDPEVLAGQGTIARELLRQEPRIDNVFVSVGGGGLISGIAAGLKAERPDIRIFGCSAAASCVMARSVAAGRMLDLPSEPTLSDGTAGGVEENTITFDYCRTLVDDWIEVEESEIASALRLFLDGHRMLIEGAAAVAIAAALKQAAEIGLSGTSVIVCCGGNIGRSTLRQIL